MSKKQRVLAFVIAAMMLLLFAGCTVTPVQQQQGTTPAPTAEDKPAEAQNQLTPEKTGNGKMVL